MFGVFGGGGGEGGRTARIRNSMNALCWERERKEDIAAAQEEVSSVVVLDYFDISLSVLLYLILSYLIHNSEKKWGGGVRTVSQIPR